MKRHRVLNTKNGKGTGGKMTEICKSCGECRYWKAMPIQSKKAEVSGSGFCCRYPPQVSDRLVEKHFIQGLTGCELSLKCSWWPGTNAADGCGEFQSKEVT